jgi:histone H3/H4
MADMVVVRSKIKELAEGMNVSGDFAESLNGEVSALIKRACERARSNKRSTVQPRDL